MSPELISRTPKPSVSFTVHQSTIGMFDFHHEEGTVIKHEDALQLVTSAVWMDQNFRCVILGWEI